LVFDPALSVQPCYALILNPIQTQSILIVTALAKI